MSYKKILVAVDLSESSRLVIDKAMELAKQVHAQLSLVFVDVNTVVMDPEEEKSLQQQLQALAEQGEYPVAETLVVTGDLHIKLAGLVKEKEMDLVVCGHHDQFFSRLFSSVPKLTHNVESADLLIVHLS